MLINLPQGNNYLVPLLAYHAPFNQKQNRTSEANLVCWELEMVNGLCTIHLSFLREENSLHKLTFSYSGNLQMKLLRWVTSLQHRDYQDHAVNHHCQAHSCLTAQPSWLSYLSTVDGTNHSHFHISFRKCHRKTSALRACDALIYLLAYHHQCCGWDMNIINLLCWISQTC